MKAHVGCASRIRGVGRAAGPTSRRAAPCVGTRVSSSQVGERDRQAVEASGSGGWGVPVELSLWRARAGLIGGARAGRPTPFR